MTSFILGWKFIIFWDCLFKFSSFWSTYLKCLVLVNKTSAYLKKAMSKMSITKHSKKYDRKGGKFSRRDRERVLRCSAKGNNWKFSAKYNTPITRCLMWRHQTIKDIHLEENPGHMVENVQWRTEWLLSFQLHLGPFSVTPGKAGWYQMADSEEKIHLFDRMIKFP